MPTTATSSPSPPPRRRAEGRQEMGSPPIPGELLMEVFLRLPDPADLVRASAACVSFRRLVADRSFRRQYRKLHAPPLLGFFDQERKAFYPAAPPHPSAVAAAAVAQAADFSFSFLPAPASDWLVRDIRDGRVLLDRALHNHHNKYRVVFPELVVCDPLHRHYLLLPPIPAHLTATVEVERPHWISHHRYCEIFLVPPNGCDGGEEETSFSVVWMGQSRTKLLAFVFSSSTGQWRAISSRSWSDLHVALPPCAPLPPFSWREYAYGCFYWVTDWRTMLLVLDTRRMEFSIAESPPEVSGLCGVHISIVEAGEGRPGMFVRLQHEYEHYYLDYTICQNSGGNSSQWQFQKTISLDTWYMLMGSMGKHLFLYQCGTGSLDPGCFLMDSKTFQLERVFVSKSCTPAMHAYINFPPSLLSTPTVSSGVEKGSEQEMLEQGCAASSSAESPRSE